jgi:hypothetical protein
MQPSNLQLYELMLEVLRGVIRLEDSFDELLVDARKFNDELSSGLDAVSRMRAIGPRTSF